MPDPDRSTKATELLALLQPILARVAELDLANCATDEAVLAVETALEGEFPHAGEQIQAIGAMLERGVAEGWLADRGDPNARFSRIAKPSEATHGLSIDLVSMIGAGLEHTHPAGEVTIGFPSNPSVTSPSHSAQGCQFEARPPGWVVLGPGSRHVPRVDGDRMNLIYFLPGGAVEWHRP